MREFFSDIKSLLYPAACELCLNPGIALCAPCAHVLSSSAHFLSGFFHPVAAGIVYNEATSEIVLRAKERGIESANRSLALSLWSAFTLLNPHERRIALVPIPSSRASIRRRGRNFIIDLLNIFLTQNNSPIEFEIHDSLIHQRKVRDQSGLTMNERIRNMDEAIVARNQITIPALIVDDVITTGATFTAAFSALNVAKNTILG
jgi:predicted amidophosphoribosyltransferase